MPTTAFDELAAIGERRFDERPIAPIAARIHGRVRRRRALRATAVGGATMVACTAIAFAAASTRDTTSPASTPGTVLDPATIETTGGNDGANLVGTCPGDDFSLGRPTAELAANQYSILTGVSDCGLASVAGPDLISAATTLRAETVGDMTSTWLRTTVTNVSDQALAFDLASPTLEVTVPDDYLVLYEVMTAERALNADEYWRDHPGIAAWGGSVGPRGRVGETITPVLDEPPTPGVAWNLVLERTSDDGFTLSTSHGTVTLEPSASFVFESLLSPPAPEDGERPTPPYSDLFQDPSQLEVAVYLALQADTDGGSDRTLVVDTLVPVTWRQ